MTTRAPAVLKIKAYVSLFFAWRHFAFQSSGIGAEMQKESVREVGLAVGCAKSLLIQNPCQFSSTGLQGLDIIDDGRIILINTSSLLECLPDLPSLTL